MFDGYPDVLSVKEAAKLLGVGTRSLYNLVREQKIGHLKIGKNIKIPKRCLSEYVLNAATCKKVL